MSNWIASLLLGAFMATTPGPVVGDSGWQQIYVVPDAKSGLSTVWSDGDEWVAAGKSLVVRGRANGIEAKELPGRTVLGIERVGRDLFALGADQFILRLEGTDWVEEHFEAPAPRATTRQKYASVLYAARMAGADGSQPLVAVRPDRRQPALGVRNRIDLLPTRVTGEGPRRRRHGSTK